MSSREMKNDTLEQPRVEPGICRFPALHGAASGVARGGESDRGRWLGAPGAQAREEREGEVPSGERFRSGGARSPRTHPLSRPALRVCTAANPSVSPARWRPAWSRAHLGQLGRLGTLQLGARGAGGEGPRPLAVARWVSPFPPTPQPAWGLVGQFQKRFAGQV